MSKFSEKLLIKDVLALHLSSLSSAQISSISDELLVKRFRKLLETLFNQAKVQCTNFISSNKLMEKMEKFDISKDRVEEFYITIFF